MIAPAIVQRPFWAPPLEQKVDGSAPGGDSNGWPLHIQSRCRSHFSQSDEGGAFNSRKQLMHSSLMKRRFPQLFREIGSQMRVDILRGL
ncbi:hypothetical protein TNCV_2567931 [Trichonephila clavipes]|uniref:Uncharacterized protein n=1 Tax=Trichonephila clavipes TaxID=2585209 RepID=A0A8X6WMQ0_TRICX|nr:hypothetical protein TNCV_2567931 [Trichonephila clavipes]